MAEHREYEKSHPWLTFSANLYLAKGIHATTAIEGNPLTEEEVLKYLKGEFKLSLSRAHQTREFDNIIKVWTEVLDIIKRGLTCLSVRLQTYQN